MTELMKRYEADFEKGLTHECYQSWLETEISDTYLNQCVKRRRVRAVYVRQYEEEAGVNEEMCAEYCEEKV